MLNGICRQTGGLPVQNARKMSAGLWKAGQQDAGQRLSVLDLVRERPNSRSGMVNGLRSALARTLQQPDGSCRDRPSSPWAFVAIVLAGDKSLVTPLRSLGRLENVGARSSFPRVL
jgi:hypothetical protein